MRPTILLLAGLVAGSANADELDSVLAHSGAASWQTKAKVQSLVVPALQAKDFRRYDDAVEELVRALRLQPGCGFLLSELVVVLLQLDRTEDAVRVAEHLHALFPDTRDAWRAHQAALMLNGQYDEAAVVARSAAERFPWASSALYESLLVRIAAGEDAKVLVDELRELEAEARTSNGIALKPSASILRKYRPSGLPEDPDRELSNGWRFAMADSKDTGRFEFLNLGTLACMQNLLRLHNGDDVEESAEECRFPAAARILKFDAKMQQRDWDRAALLAKLKEWTLITRALKVEAGLRNTELDLLPDRIADLGTIRPELPVVHIMRARLGIQTGEAETVRTALDALEQSTPVLYGEGRLAAWLMDRSRHTYDLTFGLRRKMRVEAEWLYFRDLELRQASVLARELALVGEEELGGRLCGWGEATGHLPAQACADDPQLMMQLAPIERPPDKTCTALAKQGAPEDMAATDVLDRGCKLGCRPACVERALTLAGADVVGAIGEFDPRYLSRGFYALEKPLYACYRANLAQNPLLEGELGLALVVGEDGSPDTVAVSHPLDEDVDRCVTEVVAGAQFRKPDGGPAQAAWTLHMSHAAVTRVESLIGWDGTQGAAAASRAIAKAAAKLDQCFLGGIDTDPTDQQVLQLLITRDDRLVDIKTTKSTGSADVDACVEGVIGDIKTRNAVTFSTKVEVKVAFLRPQEPHKGGAKLSEDNPTD